METAIAVFFLGLVFIYLFLDSLPPTVVEENPQY